MCAVIARSFKVTLQNAHGVVPMSEEPYEDLMETIHLLKSPANAARLLRSIKDADQGKLTEREIIEPTKAVSPRHEDRRD